MPISRIFRMVIVCSLLAVAIPANFYSDTATASGTAVVVATIPVGGTPYGIAVSPDGSKVYVSNSTGGSVSVIDTGTRSVTSTITSNIGTTPVGIVFNSTGTTAYVANFTSVSINVAGTITAVNVATGATSVLTTSTDCREILNLAITSDDSALYLACQGDGRVGKFTLSTSILNILYSVNAIAPTDVAVSADDSTLIATLSGVNQAYILDGSGSNEPSVTTGPFSVAISPVTGLAYVAGQTSGNISVVDLATKAVVGTEITVGGFLTDIKITPDGQTAIVSSLNDDKVKFVDLATSAVTDITVGDGPQSIALSLDGRYLYTANRNSNNVSVVAMPPAVPGAPESVTATAGNSQASVSWNAPSVTGGSAITGYTVTSNPGSQTCTTATTTCTVVGLTNGTTYSFTVTAANAVGEGVASSASNSVIPTAPTPIPVSPIVTPSQRPQVAVADPELLEPVATPTIEDQPAWAEAVLRMRSLTPSQIRKLTAAQLAAFPPQALAVMSFAQVKALLPRQVTELTSNQIQAIPPRSLRAMTPRTLERMRVQQIRELTTTQVEALRPVQIQNLGPTKQRLVKSRLSS